MQLFSYVFFCTLYYQINTKKKKLPGAAFDHESNNTLFIILLFKDVIVYVKL